MKPSKKISDLTYNGSQKKEFPKSKIRPTTKYEFQKLREKEKITNDNLQRLTDLICKDLKLRFIPVIYKGTEPNVKVNGKLKSKTLGHFRPGLNYITIYKFTAVRKKERATKTTLDTLLHEICHYLDYEYFKLDGSPHTKGFYMRISQLKETLLEKVVKA